MIPMTGYLDFFLANEVADTGWPTRAPGGAAGNGGIAVLAGKPTEPEPSALAGTGGSVTESRFLAKISPPSCSAISVDERKSSTSPPRRRAFPRSERLATGL